MKKHLRTTLAAVCLCTSVNSAMADIIDFSFTGRLTVVGADGTIISNADNVNAIGVEGYQTAIGANLTYDTDLGIGSTDLAFNLDFWGESVSIYDINLNFIEGSNNIEGTMLADWNNNLGMPMQIMWDATGLFNAIDLGLQGGDRVSGTNLYRDMDGDGYAETFIADVNSATPISDGFLKPLTGTPYELNQGPAPLATAAGTLGLLGAPFEGMRVHLDIGSGNSLYVTSVSAVPVPAAVWLFGTGLIALVGIARRKCS